MLDEWENKEDGKPSCFLINNSQLIISLIIANLIMISIGDIALLLKFSITTAINKLSKNKLNHLQEDSRPCVLNPL